MQDRPGFTNIHNPMLSAANLSLKTKAWYYKATRQTDSSVFFDARNAIDGLEILVSLFEQCRFNYRTSATDRQNLPSFGRVIVVADQTASLLHTLVVIHQLADLRSDISIVTGNRVYPLDKLASLITDLTAKPEQPEPTIEPTEALKNRLENEEALIIFPAPALNKTANRFSRNRAWQPEFLNLARATDTPILPVLVKPTKNFIATSTGFLAASLARPKINFRRKIPEASAACIVGELIPAQALSNDALADRALVKRMRKHVRKLGKGRSRAFETVRTIAKPELASDLERELCGATLLGQTRDHHQIYLADYSQKSLMREIGRLREFTFRKVGEGTGSRRDLDSFDRDYKHLVLWNEANQEIAGSYRIAPVRELLAKGIPNSLYTHTLFNFSTQFDRFLPDAVELGRSFVTPKYWGKSSLDYLWFGIGAYFRHNPHIRYVFGPVSISANYPRALTQEMVFFYEYFYRAEHRLVTPKNPVYLDKTQRQQFELKYASLDKDSASKLLNETFNESGYKLPVLFKQYAALYEEGGFQLLAFNIDPDFSDCIDGLFIADLTRLKANKRKRYIG